MKSHKKYAHAEPILNYPFLPFIMENWVVLLTITFLILIAYVNGWGNEFVSDDIAGIMNNTNIDNLKVIFAKPLVAFRPLLYMLVYEIGGRDPVLFRSFNIFFHWGSTLLVYLILKRMTEKPVAFMAACLYAVHPILVEAVTWISAGSYGQYTFFLLLSLWFYMKEPFERKRYYYSVAAFIMATLNSEKASIFPLILTAYVLSRQKLKTTWRNLIPYYAITAGWAIWYLMEIRQRIVIQHTVYYQQQGFDNPLVQIPVAISSYLELFFWPDKLSLYHSELTFTPIEFAVRAALTVLFFCGIAFAYKKNKYIFFWLSFFVISLIPTLLPLRIAWVVAERYVYAGTIGLVAVLAYLLYRLKPRLGVVGFYGILALLLISMTVRTIVRNIAWANEENLYIATARTAPSDFKTHNNLGWVYQKHGDYQNAIKSFRRAITLNPRYLEGTNNLALAYMEVNDYQNSLKYFQRTIELDPRYTPAYGSIGTILIKEKQFGEAEQYLKKSIALDNTYTPSYHNLGKLYELEGKTDQAIEMYKKALSIEPNTWQSQMNLGAVYYSLKQYDKAEPYTKRAHELNPTSPELLISLARIYLKLGRPQEATKALQNAIQLDPTNKQAQEMLRQLP